MPQDVLAEEVDRAGTRQEEAEEDRQGRRLAGAVAAEQRRGDAALNREADPVDRNGLAT